MVVDVLINAAFLVVGAIAGAAIPEFLRRPKIVVTGSGGGLSSPGFRTWSVSISNPQSFFGIRMPETILFGREVLRPRSMGLHIDRRAAECSAHLKDSDGSTIGLWFIDQTEAGVSKPVPTMTVVGRAPVNVLVFASLENDSRYFIFQAAGNQDLTPKVPPESAHYTDTRTFELRVHLINGGGRSLVHKVRMRRSMEGLLYAESIGRDGSSSGLFS